MPLSVFQTRGAPPLDLALRSRELSAARDPSHRRVFSFKTTSVPNTLKTAPHALALPPKLGSPPPPLPAHRHSGGGLRLPSGQSSPSPIPCCPPLCGPPTPGFLARTHPHGPGHKGLVMDPGASPGPAPGAQHARLSLLTYKGPWVCCAHAQPQASSFAGKGTQTDSLLYSHCSGTAYTPTDSAPILFARLGTPLNGPSMPYEATRFNLEVGKLSLREVRVPRSR